MKKSSIIKLSTLGAILILLVIAYVIIAINIYSSDGTQNLPQIEEGEGIYIGENITLYPEIDKNNIVSIYVKNQKDEYRFYLQEQDGESKMVIEGHEKLTYQMEVYAYLLSYTRLPVVPKGTNIFRDVDENRMVNYGLTEETCQAKFTITYKDGDKEGSYTVLIGNKIMSSQSLYYARVVGRDSVYTLNGAGVEKAILMPLTEYVTPAVLKHYDDTTAAFADIKNFGVFLTSDLGQTLKSLVLLNQVKEGENVYYDLTCAPLNGQAVLSDSAFVDTVFGQLFVSFAGDRVMEILYSSASEEEVNKSLEKYGLGSGQECYFVRALTDEGTTLGNFISKETTNENGKRVRYVLAYYYEEPTIVEVSAEYFEFLGEDNETYLKWIQKSFIQAGFGEFLSAQETGSSGIKTLEIKTQVGGRVQSCKFTVEGTSGNALTIRSEDGSLVFKTSNNTTTYIEPFTNMYMLILSLPRISGFTELTSEEKAEIMVESKLVYSLDIETRDGTVYSYKYYAKNSSFALAEVKEGKRTENGVEYTLNQTIFEVKSRHLYYIDEAFAKLLQNQDFNYTDYVG